MAEFNPAKTEYDAALEIATRELVSRLNRHYSRINRLRNALRFYALEKGDDGKKARAVLLEDQNLDEKMT